MCNLLVDGHEDYVTTFSNVFHFFNNPKSTSESITNVGSSRNNRDNVITSITGYLNLLIDSGTFSYVWVKNKEINEICVLFTDSVIYF